MYILEVSGGPLPQKALCATNPPRGRGTPGGPEPDDDDHDNDDNNDTTI